jgi:hypothetical protein
MVEHVERLRKPACKKEVREAWDAEWSKEGKKVNRQKLLLPQGFSRSYLAVGW